MTIRETIRPGGRSARVQEAVHRAVGDLSARIDRADLTIPLIASEAGVTPSTVYRRWGDLTALLGDVAIAHLRPDADPRDFGALKDDLLAWAEQYAEEMASAPGRAMIRDVMASTAKGAERCCAYTCQQIEVIAARAVGRGENVPPVDTLIDRVVAPIMYRILFDGGAVTAKYVQRLVGAVLADETE